MLRLTDKNSKIYLYIFFLFFLTSIFNLNIVSFLNNIFLVKEIKLNEKTYKNKFDQIYNQNIFKINKIELKEILKKIPIIESFKINIIYPNKLEINLFEAKPLVKVLFNNEIHFLGSNGNLFKQKQNNFDIPIIKGKFDLIKTNEFLDILKKTKFELNEISELKILPSGRWDMIFKDRTIIKLPLDQSEEIIKKIQIIYNNQNFKTKVIDARIKDKIIVSK